MLLGTLLCQVYYYHLSFRRDSKWLKGLVYLILIFDLCQTALSTHSAFHTFVLYYGNPQVLQMSAKTVIGLSLFGGLVGGAVQLFYAWRIWTLARWAVHKPSLVVLVVVIVLTTILSTISAITASFLYLNIDSQPGIYATILFKLYTIWYSASFAVDTIIALAMVFLISNAKTNAPFRRTSNILTQILIRAVATGVINAIINGLGILLLLKYPAFDLSEVPSYLVGKLYSNTLMVALNARYTDADQDNTGPTSIELSTSRGGSSGTGPRRGGGNGGFLSRSLRTLTFTPNSKANQTSTTVSGTQFGNGSGNEVNVTSFSHVDSFGEGRGGDKGSHSDEGMRSKEVHALKMLSSRP